MIKKGLEFLRNKWILQPFLLGAYIVLTSLEDFGVSTLKWGEPLLIFIAALSFWTLVFFLSKLLFRDNFKSSYTATFIVFTTMFFTSIYETVYFVSWIRARHVIVVITLVFIGLFLLSIRDKMMQRASRKKICLFLNIIFLVLNIQAITGVFTELLSKRSSFVVKNSAKKQNVFCPDIYLIILDGYANTKSLDKYWNYNDSPFINKLTAFGFFHALDSKSNYDVTTQSVSSFLNLDYLKKNEIRGEAKILHKIRTNETVKLLKQNNYKIFNFSLADIDESKSQYGVEFFNNITNFYSIVFSKTIFYYFDQQPLSAYVHSDRALKIKRELEPIIRSKTIFPKFIYYHSMLTHFPYYLDGNGKINAEVEKQNPSLKTIQGWALNTGINNKFNTTGSLSGDTMWMKSYLNHLKYTNGFALEMINNILSRNRTPPIIIVMSDHGFRFLVNQPMRNVEAERYSNFCSVYFPDKDYKSLYDSITPINVMRAVLNKAVSTEFERLPDKSGLSTNN